MRPFFLSLSCFFLASPVFAKDMLVVLKNNRAVSKIQRERVMDASQDFTLLLGRSPFDPTLQFNLGSSLLLLGEKEKSLELYQQLLSATDKALGSSTISNEEKDEWAKVKYGLLYNLGFISQLEKKNAEALEYYQQALDLQPDSPEIKTNIELMFQGGQGQGGGDQDQKDKKDQQDQKDNKGQDQQGENKEPKDQKDKDQKPQPEDKKDDKKDQKKKPEFDPSQMSQEDLKRIMEELKQQEQAIRAKFQNKGGKDANKEKEW